MAGALLSLRPDPVSGLRGGGPWSGALVGVVGFFLLGLGPIAGAVASLAAAVIVLLGSALVYLRLRPFLDRVAVPIPPPVTAPSGAPSAYGRTEEPLASGPPPSTRR